MNFFKKYRWVITLGICYVLIRIISKQTFFIDKIYYGIFYKKFSILLRKLTAFTSISIGDCLYFILIFYTIYQSFYIKRIWKKNAWTVINNLCICLTIFIVSFNIFWGFNYYRTPLYERLKVTNTYTETELKEVTQLLVYRLNTIHLKYTNNKKNIIKIPNKIHDVYDQAADGYQILSSIYPEFTYKITDVKSSLFSLPLTYMGFSGYINPFTNEAQINNKVPKINLFVTTSHEIAHQIGIGPEAEANFVGYLAAKNNTNLYFDYAATSFALRYCLTRYPFKNETEFKTYLQKINPGIIEDWKENKAFWEAHQSFIDTFFKFIYDKFLKVNQQEFGIEGYSRFLDLLIHYELNEKRMN